MSENQSATIPGLTVRGLRVEHEKRVILDGVDLTVAAGEVCAVMGVSGAGKSTLLRSIVALQAFSAGRIEIGDVALMPGPVPRESALKKLRRRVGVVFQSHALFENLSALDNVTLAPIHALAESREAADGKARALLDSLGVLHRADALPRQLSGGEAQRVAIARALAPNPVLLLMDEPTSALDPARRGALAESLRALAASGRALLIVTHDVEFARSVADRVVVLAQGTIAEQGPAVQILSNPTHPATRELLDSPA